MAIQPTSESRGSFHPTFFTYSFLLMLPFGYAAWQNRSLLNRVSLMPSTLHSWRVDRKTLKCTHFLWFYRFYYDGNRVEIQPDIISTAQNRQEIIRRLKRTRHVQRLPDGNFQLSLLAPNERQRIIKMANIGHIAIIQQEDTATLYFIDEAHFIRIDNIKTDPPIIQPDYSLREKIQRLIPVQTTTKKSNTHFKLTFAHTRSPAFHFSRFYATVQLTETHWAWTIISKKGHAILVLEGINRLGEPFTTKIHLMAFDDNGKHVGFIVMEDSSYWPVRFSGKSATHAITKKQGQQLLNTIQQEAYVSIDPLNPATYAHPTLRTRPFNYGTLGDLAILGNDDHNCISFILTRLQNAGVSIKRHLFDRLATTPYFYITDPGDGCSLPACYHLPPYLPPH